VPIAEGLKRTIAWHRERKCLWADASNSPLKDAIPVLIALRKRSALDSFGREMNPAFIESDALSTVEAIRAVASLDSPQVAALARHVRLGLVRQLEKIALAVGNRA
jgi:hypothetical protein